MFDKYTIVALIQLVKPKNEKKRMASILCPTRLYPYFFCLVLLCTKSIIPTANEKPPNNKLS